MIARISTYEQDNAQPATELRNTTKTLMKLPRVEKTSLRPREVLGIGGGQLRRRDQYDHRANDHASETLQPHSADEPREERDSFAETAVQKIRTGKQ